ncbi:MAG: energy transducer TonB [Acidobacteria bacterium]|nr:energy transducer TonB [Acidobacteriota bacterium]
MMEAGPFSSRPARRFRLGLGGALLISLLLHFLLLVWLMFSGAADILILPVGTAVSQRERSPSSLQFTFVDLPDDQGVKENPRAQLLSDKTRAARQSVPTPPDATRFSADPHAEGNSPLRQVMRPAAPPTPSTPPPAGGNTRGHDSKTAGSPGSERPVPSPGDSPQDTPAQTEQGPQTGGGTDGNQGSDTSAEDRRTAFQKALRQLESGTYDFSGFDNPAYLQGNNYGTLSFDTKGFDWGDYARQLYLIIKKNWYDRIPIAAYYGQKGRVFIRFVIEKDGSITDLAVLRSSDIAPFDRAAENAIRASNPLPPLPPNFPKEAEGVTFGFFYNLPIDQP